MFVANSTTLWAEAGCLRRLNDFEGESKIPFYVDLTFLNLWHGQMGLLGLSISNPLLTEQKSLRHVRPHIGPTPGETMR